MEIKKRAYQILQDLYGKNAEFRKGQLEAIEATLSHKRTLVVQKTGWGKSLVYFLATKFLREQGKGVALIVSPLLVLMENQFEAANKLQLKLHRCLIFLEILNLYVFNPFPFSNWSSVFVYSCTCIFFV